MRILKGDMVVVSAGDDRAKQPRRVLRLVEGGARIVVEGVNRVYRHVRKGHPKSPQGGRLSVECRFTARSATAVFASEVVLMKPERSFAVAVSADRN
jgi:ribosomal protein L24